MVCSWLGARFIVVGEMMHLSGHLGGARCMEPPHLYWRVAYVHRYRRGAPKDGASARSNLLGSKPYPAQRHCTSSNRKCGTKSSIDTCLQVHTQGKEEETQEHMLRIVLIRLSESHTSGFVGRKAVYNRSKDHVHHNQRIRRRLRHDCQL